MGDEIRKIGEGDREFPDYLRTIPLRPKEIYVRGLLDLKLPAVAIVGTRVPTDYGKQAAHDIAANLARAGVCIVSGLANGIDSIANAAAVENNSPTIAVLGTGLDDKVFYPKQNLTLAHKIIESGGCLVSEYPQGFSATNYSFPQRNRLIAGLSLAVIVVEAKEKSGSLITADWGFKQHKLVFAVPGSIYSANSRGCHWLLKNGALVCESASDILDALGLTPAAKKITANVSPDEQKILDALAGGALDVDRIIKISGLKTKTVASLLPVLEIKELIHNLGNGKYSLNR